MATEVSDLLTMHDVRSPRKRGFLTRTCFYWYIAMSNKSQVGFTSVNDMRNRVLTNDKVQEAIEKTLNNDGAGNCSIATRTGAVLKVEATAKEMIGTVTTRVIRFCGWIYLTLLKQVCGSVQFTPKQMELMKELSEQTCPVVYMPLHFSHLDYILLSLLLFHNDIKVPHIASGNNLHLPIIGYFIKKAGGFFIRRKIEEKNGKDYIYRAVLQAYITELLKEGRSIEVFIEGTRSRSGLPNLPKTGFLSLLVDAITEKNVFDVTIVPVHTSYEKLLEGNYNAELLGKAKKPESLWDTCKSVARLFFGYYGNIKVNFGRPISMRAALKDINQYLRDPSNVEDDANSSFDLISSAMSRRHVSDLAEHIIYHGMTSGSFMASHLIAYLLVNRFRAGVVLEDLVDAYCRLKIQITSKGRDLAFCGEPQEVVLRTLDLFDDRIVDVHCINGDKDQESLPISNSDANDVSTDDADSEKADSGIFVNGNDDIAINWSIDNVEKSTLYIKPNIAIPSVFELTYYANALTPLFAVESIICLAVNAVTGFRYSMIDTVWKNAGTSDIFEDSLPQKIKVSFRRSALVEKTLELCDLLQLDFLLCDVFTNLEDCIQDRVQELVSGGFFLSTVIGSQKRIHQSYGIDDECNMVDDELLKVNLHSTPQFLCYQSVLSPFIEALCLVVEQLPALSTPMSTKDFLSKVLSHAQLRVRSGLATRIECCSSETVLHCIRAFEQNGVVRNVDGLLSVVGDCDDPAYFNTLLSKIHVFLM